MMVATRLFLIILALSSFPDAACMASLPDLAPLEATELHQQQRGWAILDARPKSAWQAGHIPGAHSFSWDDFTRSDDQGTPYRVWPAQDLAAVLAQMGIDENTPIVVYGDADKSWGGEGWVCWVLSWLGHRGLIRLLAGGIQAWQAQGLPVTNEPPKGDFNPSLFRVSLRPHTGIQPSGQGEKAASMILSRTRDAVEWLIRRFPKAYHLGEWQGWLLSRVDHRHPIALLAGGIQAWRSCGYPLRLTLEVGGTKPCRYQISLRPELDITAPELEGRGTSMVLIDTRSTMEWLTGHIPNAIHIPWTDFHSGKERRPLDPAALRKHFEDHGVDLSKPIVYYCAGGIRSGFAWAVHTMCGLPDAHNYEGGMEAWKRRSSK